MKLTSLLAAACLLTACDKKNEISESEKSAHTEVSPPPSAPAKKEEKKTCCPSHPAPKATESSEDSIYQISSIWKNASGKDLSLNSLGGKVQVITMGYSTCQFACPRLLADMRIIEAGLSKEIREKTGFAFFSIDPDTDTPARLTEYRKENNINPTRWALLTSSKSNVQELAVVLGLKYRRVNEVDFAHSNLIIVLDEKGQIIHRQEGLAADPATTIKAIIDAQ